MTGFYLHVQKLTHCCVGNRLVTYWKESNLQQLRGEIMVAWSIVVMVDVEKWSDYCYI